MADKNKNRKSDRHFNLEKYVVHSFVIEKDADILEAVPTKSEPNKQKPVVPPIAPVKKPENIKMPSNASKVEDVKKPEIERNPSGSPKVEDAKKPEGNAAPYKPEGDASDGKSSKWKWLIPAAIVVAAVPSYFLFTGNDDTPSTENPIVATAPEAGQNNAGGDAANPNASAGESDNSDNVANPDGSGDVDNTGGPGNPSGSENLGSGDNSSEVGNVGNISSHISGNVGNASSGSGNIGSASAAAKASTPESAGVQSSPNKGTSVSSTASAGNSSIKDGKTGTSSMRGTTGSGDSKNSGTPDNCFIPGSIEQKALDVIRGIYGNGQVRKDKLGAEYAEIQKLVNEMYRNGTIKR